MKRILVVDDEVQILKAMTRMFMDTDFEVLTAESGAEALELMKANEIDMIISDMRMPVMDGYKLLSIVKEQYPRVIRIILSGYAEEKPMFRALLHNVARLYVFKPWNNAELLQKINKLFAVDLALNSNELMKRIEDANCACDLTDSCKNLLSKIKDEDLDVLITEIEKDAEVSELLLQVSKTGIYGVMPNNVKQAATYIGIHNLKSFLHWACVVTSFDDSKNETMNPEILTRHAYLTNRIFLFFYEAFHHKQPPEATLFAGLIHNVGLMLLLKSIQSEARTKKVFLTPQDYIELENGEYEVFHQEVGAHFLDEWDLPFPLHEVTLYHHRPLDASIISNELVCAVHIAQSYAWKAITGEEHTLIHMDVFEALGVSVDDFERRLARYLK